MNILITNMYSSKNKGDYAILVALISEIKRVFPGASIHIQTIDVINDKDKYGTPISSSLMWILLSSLRDKPLLIRIFKLIIRTLGLIIFLLCYHALRVRLNVLLNKELKEYVTKIFNSDLVIATGGGYIRTPGSSPSAGLLLFVTCLNFLSSYYLGRPLYLYSQSIGPIHGWIQRMIVKFSLNRARLIEVRESMSLQFVNKLNLRAPVVLTSDPAFILKGQSIPSSIDLKSAPLLIGITVRRWFKKSSKHTNYVKSVAKLVDYLIKEYQAQVICTPQVISERFGDDDRKVTHEIWEQVRQKKQFKAPLEDLHPLELIDLYSKMDIFIGIRMHSNIFALLSNVPIVSIQCEHKAKGIMKGLGIEESATVDIDNLNFKTLKKATEYVLDNRNDYQKIIKKNIKEQIKLSKTAIEFIKRDLEGIKI